MKKSILSLSFAVALLSPTLFGIEAYASPIGGVGIKVENPDQGAYTPAGPDTNKKEIWSSSLRALGVGFVSTLAGAKLGEMGSLGKETGGGMGAATGAGINYMWTNGSDQQASSTPQIVAHFVGCALAYLALQIKTNP